MIEDSEQLIEQECLHKSILNKFVKDKSKHLNKKKLRFEDESKKFKKLINDYDLDIIRMIEE